MRCIDRTTKTNTYASGLLPDWNKAVTAKAPPKTQSSKRSRLEVVEAGLADSDADAINPFSSRDASNVQKPQTASNSKVVALKRDVSRQNEVRTQLWIFDQSN